MRIDKLQAEWHIDVRFVHFPLHPETPADGISLERLFAGRGFDIEAAKERIKRAADKEGLPYGNRTMTYNSRLAQELASYAVTQPDGEQIHDTLFRAYFVDGKNLSSIEALVEIGQSIGLDPDACRDVLTNRTHSANVDADWDRSLENGITAVPTFVAGRSMVAGAQPYAVLEQLLERAGATRR